MKQLLHALALLILLDMSASAQDKNFYIFLCFGQSNMEGYPAVPPLARPGNGLSPADYFGRMMVANLPPNIKVGVITVAVAGSRIELFQKDKPPLIDNFSFERPSDFTVTVERLR